MKSVIIATGVTHYLIFSFILNTIISVLGIEFVRNQGFFRTGASNFLILFYLLIR